MRAISVDQTGAFTLMEVPIPEPTGSQVLLRVTSCGLCGTDEHVLDGKYALADYPLTPGHEIGGEVVQVGSEVRGLVSGDRVAVDPNCPCRSCPLCHVGHTNLCQNLAAYGVTQPGGFAEYVVVEEVNCHVLPPGFNPDLVPLVEPLSCVLHGLDRLGPVTGDSVLVFGGGPIGVLIAMTAMSTGAASVEIVDHSPDRVQQARRLGLTARKEASDAEGDWGVVVDATGSPAAFRAGFLKTGRRGRFLVLGVPGSDGNARIDFASLVTDEKTIIGSFSLAFSMSRAINMLNNESWNIGELITAQFPLDDFGSAVQSLRSRRAQKTVVIPSKPDGYSGL